MHVPKTGGTSLVNALDAYAASRGLTMYHDHKIDAHGRGKKAKRASQPKAASQPAALPREGGSASSSAPVDAAASTWGSYSAISNSDAHTLIIGTAPSPASAVM